MSGKVTNLSIIGLIGLQIRHTTRLKSKNKGMKLVVKFYLCRFIKKRIGKQDASSIKQR